MYQFCKANVADDYYRCCMSRSAKVAVKCRGSISLSKDKTHVTKKPTEHNHPKQLQAAPIVKRLRNNAKVRVMLEPKTKPNTILLEEIGQSCRDEGLEINTDTAKIIPNFSQLSKSLYTLRKKDEPLEPKTTDDIDLSDDRYKLTNDVKRY